MGSMMMKARDFLGWGAMEEHDDFEVVGEQNYGQVYDVPASVVELPSRDFEAQAPMTTHSRSVAPDVRPSDVFRIETVHPTSFNDARAIGEYFRNGVPVVVNLTDMPEDEARRVLDFIAGLAFGLKGDADRVTSRVFLLTPANVEVTDHLGRDRG